MPISSGIIGVIMNCLRCPRCKGIMRAVDVYSEKEKCISWTCYRCGEMIDREILENRANYKRRENLIMEALNAKASVD
jgi:hypothetical protein